ncbi:TlpA family protein disulfide reductase [Rhizomonospora bruguierae]|uniref:TlpA family protein disulfide reductase n=1 Tax=Rhizomonospora bruguierae TaxID=1581705 RepID=UPI001BCAF9E4|nr:TlpA disulfide reductase family protein [Micromonospora sp. NBRC 107566]
MRRFVPPLLAAALALAGCTGSPGGSGAECTTGADHWVRCTAGKRPAAPALAGETLTGDRYDLAQQRGQVVVVNFWGSWCPPCRAEADDLAGVYAKYKDRGVGFVGINVRDDRDTAKAFEAGRHEYPSIFDPASRLALGFRDLPPVTVPPVTVVVDRAGNVAAMIRQAVTEDELAAVVGRIAAEPAPAGAR